MAILGGGCAGLSLAATAGDWPDVEMTVIDAPEAVKGDTASNVQKPVTVDTGITIHVPLFIKKDEKIKVSTADKSYLGRA